MSDGNKYSYVFKQNCSFFVTTQTLKIVKVEIFIVHVITCNKWSLLILKNLAPHEHSYFPKLVNKYRNKVY